MNTDSVREHLKALQDELVAARAAKPHDERLLGSLSAEIQQLIEQPDGVNAAGPVADPVADRLERLAVQFEIDHPTLAASSRRLVDLLGKVGI